MTITITEHNGLSVFNGVAAQCLSEPAVAEQVVETSTTSTQSKEFNRNTKYLRINNDSQAPIHLSFGTDPVATVANRRMSPNQTEVFDVFSGHQYKLAVIEGTN